MLCLAVAALVSSGCSNGNSSGGGGGDGKPATQTAPDPAADKAKAAAASLQAADFPAGWKSAPHQQLPGEDKLDTQLASCLGVPQPSTHSTADVRSPDFTTGIATTASSRIRYVRTVDDAVRDATAYTSPKFVECLEAPFSAQIAQVAPPGAKVANVRAASLAFPSYGDRSTATRVSATLNIGPTTVPLTIDLVRVYVGRAEVEFTFRSPGQPFSASLERALVGKVVGRL